MGIYNLLFSLLQTNIPIEGLDKAAESGEVTKVLVWIVSVAGALLLGVVGLLWKELSKKTKQLEDSKDDYAKKIEDLTRSHLNKIDEINNTFIKRVDDVRLESTKRNDTINTLLMNKVDEWNKQWAESEKYAMDVIKGLNKLIENGDIMTSNRHTQILDKLSTLETNLINSIKLLENSFNRNG
jgi:hypothetical protein